MAEDFSSKDYGEYFLHLERELEQKSERYNEQEQFSANVPDVPQTERKDVVYGKKRYKKRSLLKPAVAVCTAIAVILCGCFAVKLLKKAPKKAETPENEKSFENITAVTPKNDVKKESLFPVFDENVADPGSDIVSRNVIMIDLEKNTVVAARNAEERAYPASTTKIMTLMVAAENITDMNDTFTMSYEVTDPLYIAEATVAGFAAGEHVKMIDLLYGTVLPSGADAAMGLAIKLCGNEAAFVGKMNEKAADLGLKDTHFTNCTGLYDPNHYTTVQDMAVILRAAMQNDICRAIISTYQYTTSATEQHPQGIQLSSTLFSYMYGTEPEGATVRGGKTGYTNESGYCIASFGESETGTEYICVAFGGTTRWPAVYDQINLYTKFAGRK